MVWEFKVSMIWAGWWCRVLHQYKRRFHCSETFLRGSTGGLILRHGHEECGPPPKFWTDE